MNASAVTGTMRFVLLAVSIGVVGCSKPVDPKTANVPPSSPPPAQVREVPSGWKAITAHGFSISVPGDWTTIDLTSKNLDAILDAINFPGDTGPTMKQDMKGLAQQGAFKVYAFGPNVTDGFRENLSVHALPTDVTDLKLILDANLQQMRELSKNARGRLEKNPDRTIIDATLTAPGPGGREAVFETHTHQLLHAGLLYTLTFSCKEIRRDVTEKMAAKVIGTLAFD